MCKSVAQDEKDKCPKHYKVLRRCTKCGAKFCPGKRTDPGCFGIKGDERRGCLSDFNFSCVKKNVKLIIFF